MVVCRILVLVCLLVLVGCSGSGGDESGGSTTASAGPVTEVESTTTTVVVEREELEIPTEWDTELDEIYGRYLLYREAFNIAAGPPVVDPEYGPLQELSAGEQADLDRELFERRVDEGVIGVQPPDSIGRAEIKSPQGARSVAKTEGNEFVFGTCVVDDDIVKNLEGDVLNDRVESFFQDVEMTVVDGEWRVTGRAVRGEAQEGEEACENFLP